MFFKFVGSFAITLALSAPALAATSSNTYTFVTPLDTLPSASLDLPATGTARVVSAGDDFLDTFIFTLSQNSYVFGDFASAVATRGSLTIKGLAFDSISLVPSSGPTIFSGSVPSFDFGPLAVGTYKLVVHGHAIGSQGGSYIGSLASETLPVPEPESILLSIAGVAVAASLVRRRQTLA